MRRFKVLVVDDFELFRRLICSILELRMDFQVIGLASDGLEAIQKAEKLQPDLILLDIGLPTLAGIEVGRRLGKVAPHSRFLFLSQESSPDVVQAALNLGAIGYVHKARIISDLLPALEAFTRGMRFVSSDLEVWEADSHSPKQDLHRHGILVYSNEAALIVSFTHLVGTNLRVGNSAIVNGTKSHLHDLNEALTREGLNVEAAIQAGTYLPLDVANLPSTILGNWCLDFVGLLEQAFKAAKGDTPRVVICGEGTGRLWAEGRVEEAIRVEEFCTDLTKTHEVDILCAFPGTSMRGEEQEQAFRRIYAEHSPVHSQ